MAYHAPTTLDAALAALGAGGVSVLAGGTDVYPALAGQGARTALVDLTRIAELRGIAPRAGGGWRLGATTTWAEIAAAPLPPAFAALQQAAREVGARQIQNAGTIAGNLCNASPAADGVPPLLVLDARVELASAAGKRVLALGDFITGVRRTALRPGEIVTAVLIPPLPGATSAFAKLGARRYLVISIAMAAALVEVAEGRIARARIAVGACSPVALRLGALEKALQGRRADRLSAARLVTPAHLDALSPIDDVRADAAYRREAAGELVRRVLSQALGGAEADDA